MAAAPISYACLERRPCLDRFAIGTFGCNNTSTPYRFFNRATAISTCITMKRGIPSSAARAYRPDPRPSTADRGADLVFVTRDFGSIANEITGSILHAGISDQVRLSASVSPVCVSFSFATAAISPA
jgi:hypothetical protein